MLDRVKFWGSSLGQGAAQLNSAAGWFGLVILVLGVAAGITVPLVFNLSPWLTAVVLMGLLIVVWLEGSYRIWHTTDLRRTVALAERDTARDEVDRRFGSIRYALNITGLVPSLIPGPSAMDVQISLTFTNSSNEYIRYEIENVSTLIEGQRSPDGPLLNTASIVPPHGTDTLTPPAAAGAPLDWQNGSMSLTVRYGHASGNPRYRRRWEYAVQGIRQLGPQQGQVSQVNLAPMTDPEVEDI